MEALAAVVPHDQEDGGDRRGVDGHDAQGVGGAERSEDRLELRRDKHEQGSEPHEPQRDSDRLRDLLQSCPTADDCSRRQASIERCQPGFVGYGQRQEVGVGHLSRRGQPLEYDHSSSITHVRDKAEGVGDEPVATDCQSALQTGDDHGERLMVRILRMRDHAKYSVLRSRR